MESRPQFRVGVAGLDPRDRRLIEIVFRHSQYNRFGFRLVDPTDADAVDLLVVDAQEAEGLRALSRVRERERRVPVIHVVPRGVPASAPHAIAVDRLTLQLLPILNLLVEESLLPRPHPEAQQPSGEREVDDPPVRVPATAVASSLAPAATPAAPAPASVPTRGAAQAGASGASNLLVFPRSGPEPPISQRLRVLVVDDSPTVRRQLRVAFDRMGIVCEPVESAAKALACLAAEHFDLALLDVVMPEMDGYQLTREIRRNRQWRQMPVIMLTSRSSPFDLARGAIAGCDAYLSKPVPYRALEAAVVRQLRRALAIDDLTGLIRTAPRPAPSDDRAGLTPASLKPDDAGSPKSGVIDRLLRR